MNGQKPLGDLLHILSNSDRMVPDEADRQRLIETAMIFRDPARFVTHQGQPIVVLVTGGAEADELASMLAEALDELADVNRQIHQVGDNLREMQTQMRDRLAQTPGPLNPTMRLSGDESRRLRIDVTAPGYGDLNELLKDVAAATRFIPEYEYMRDGPPPDMVSARERLRAMSEARARPVG